MRVPNAWSKPCFQSKLLPLRPCQNQSGDGKDRWTPQLLSPPPSVGSWRTPATARVQCLGRKRMCCHESRTCENHQEKKDYTDWIQLETRPVT